MRKISKSLELGGFLSNGKKMVSSNGINQTVYVFPIFL